MWAQDPGDRRFHAVPPLSAAGLSACQLAMQEPHMSNVINWPARFAEMVNFVGLSEEDRQLIKASAPIILARAGKLNDFVYDQLLKYPEARQFFVTADDEPDGPR